MGRKDDADCVKVLVAPVGRVTTWQNIVSADMRLLKVDTWDIRDGQKWTPWCKANQQRLEPHIINIQGVYSYSRKTHLMYDL